LRPAAGLARSQRGDDRAGRVGQARPTVPAHGARPLLIRRAIFCIAALAAACAPSPAPHPTTSLVVGIVGDPPSLLADDPVARLAATAIVEPIVRRTATEDLEPRLVASVPTFANGDLRLAVDAAAPTGRLVATFHLRAGLRWHDGEPLTADDVRF